MRSNEAHDLIFGDRNNEKFMETRVARIESDVSHIKTSLANVQHDVRELRSDMKMANQAIAELRSSVASLDERIDSKIDAKVTAMESKLIKWMIGTALTSTAVAISFARFVHP